MKIDLGSGLNCPEGYKGMDKYKFPGVDYVQDLEFGIPLESESLESIRAYDILEHLSNPNFIMNEIWRTLKNNKWVDIFIPSTDGRGAFQDPTHKSFWNSNSFFYYTVENISYLKLNWTYGFIGGFKIIKMDEIKSQFGVIHIHAILEKLSSLDICIKREEVLGDDHWKFIPTEYASIFKKLI